MIVPPTMLAATIALAATLSAVTASFARLASMTLPATILPDTTAFGASLSASTASLAISGVPTAPGGSYSFNPDPADGSTINTGTGSIANAVGGSHYNIQYLTNGTCPDSRAVRVTIRTAPNARILKDDADGLICEDNCIQFTYKIP